MGQRLLLFCLPRPFTMVQSKDSRGLTIVEETNVQLPEKLLDIGPLTGSSVSGRPQSDATGYRMTQ